MGKKLIYVVAGVCFVTLLLFVFVRPHEKKFDKAIVLDKKYKIPYGLYLARTFLPKMFASSTVEENRQSPRDWYNADSSANGQYIFFLISEQFNPDREELNDLLDFAKDGNQVFICTPRMNETAKVYFGIGEEYGYTTGNYINDSGQTILLAPPYKADTTYFNPGYHFGAHFFGLDSSRYTILGKDSSGYANFIKVDVGKGSFYLHSNPFLFDNYFLLYHNNLNYFEKAISLMPPDKKKIIWDEYYVYHLGSNRNTGGERSPFRVLWAVSAFRWAISLALILLALYIALGIKRLQRIVPLFARPKNETLEFTKTIGRLYFEKGDNTNLAKKMATYLLEHIRNRYFVKTTVLDEEFIKNLTSKSGFGEAGVKEITGHLVYIQGNNRVTEKQLAEIYESFSKFYKHSS